MRNASEQRASSAAGSSPTSSTRVDRHLPDPGAVAHLRARALDPGRRQVDEVHAHLHGAARRERQPERADAEQTAVALARLAGDAPRDRRRRSVASSTLTATAAVARRRRSRRGGDPVRRVRGRARARGERVAPHRRQRRGRRARRRRRRRPAPGAPGRATRRTRGRRRRRRRRASGRGPRTARRRRHRAGGARRRGPARSRSSSATSVSRRAAASVIAASRAAIVKTLRWWSGSVCTSTSARPAAAPIAPIRPRVPALGDVHDRFEHRRTLRVPPVRLAPTIGADAARARP